MKLNGKQMFWWMCFTWAVCQNSADQCFGIFSLAVLAFIFGCWIVTFTMLCLLSHSTCHRAIRRHWPIPPVSIHCGDIFCLLPTAQLFLCWSNKSLMGWNNRHIGQLTYVSPGQKGSPVQCWVSVLEPGQSLPRGTTDGGGFVHVLCLCCTGANNPSTLQVPAHAPQLPHADQPPWASDEKTITST